jgi:hypothetical protein
MEEFTADQRPAGFNLLEVRSMEQGMTFFLRKNAYDTIGDRERA